MSNVSTRVSNNNLIELAKQNYEKTQTSKIPGSIIELPSKGLVYPESSPLRSGTVEIRYMTAYDEDILTNGSYIKQGVMLDKLLESIVMIPGFKSSDLIVPDKEWLIISARIISYGSDYQVSIKTPAGDLLETSVNLSKLKFEDFKLKSNAYGEFEYITEFDNKIKYKYPTNFVLNNLPDDQTVSFLLKNCITQINDLTTPAEIDDFLKYSLRSIESRKFRKHLIETTPVLDMTYEFEYTTKEGNKEAFRATFPIGPDFFWV
jgi:hypothetical protein